MDNKPEQIQKEKAAAVIGIIGYIFILMAVNLAESEITAHDPKVKEIYNKKGQQASTIGSLSLLIALIIRGRIANLRLEEKKESLVKGEKADSITPDIYITSGYALGILGNALRLIGNLMRLNAPQQ
jgi:hypothetical protein